MAARPRHAKRMSRIISNCIVDGTRLGFANENRSSWQPHKAAHHAHYDFSHNASLCQVFVPNQHSVSASSRGMWDIVLAGGLGIALVWVFNLWGSADLPYAFYQGNHVGL